MALESPPIAIAAVTEADVDELTAVLASLDALPHHDRLACEGDGGAAVRFYGKLVAVCNEYGTVACLPGADREGIERLLEVANDVWPSRYLVRLVGPEDPLVGRLVRICHRCGYNEENHRQLEARGAVSGPPYHEGCCGDFLPVPEHLRF